MVTHIWNLNNALDLPSKIKKFLWGTPKETINAIKQKYLKITTESVCMINLRKIKNTFYGKS